MSAQWVEQQRRAETSLFSSSAGQLRALVEGGDLVAEALQDGVRVRVAFDAQQGEAARAQLARLVGYRLAPAREETTLYGRGLGPEIGTVLCEPDPDGVVFTFETMGARVALRLSWSQAWAWVQQIHVLEV